MTAWMLVLSVLLFFVVLLLCPLSLRVFYREAPEAKLQYLFFSYSLVPAKPRRKNKRKKAPPKEKPKKKEEPKKKKSAFQDIIKEKGLSGFLDLMRLLFSISTEAAGTVYRHLIITQLSLQMTVTAGDAAQTAIRYGEACAVVYPALGLLCSGATCKKREVTIRAGFEETESRVDFRLKLHIKPLFLLGAALRIGFRLVKALVQQKLEVKKEEKSQTTQMK